MAQEVPHSQNTFGQVGHLGGTGKTQSGTQGSPRNMMELRMEDLLFLEEPILSAIAFDVSPPVDPHLSSQVSRHTGVTLPVAAL